MLPVPNPKSHHQKGPRRLLRHVSDMSSLIFCITCPNGCLIFMQLNQLLKSMVMASLLHLLQLGLPRLLKNLQCLIATNLALRLASIQLLQSSTPKYSNSLLRNSRPTSKKPSNLLPVWSRWECQKLGLNVLKTFYHASKPPKEVCPPNLVFSIRSVSHL